MPPMSVADHPRDSGSGMPGQKLCQCRSRCGTTGRWVDRQTYENHLLDFDDGCSSGSDDGGAGGGTGELVDDFGQDPMDYINEEQGIELDIRPDAGLLPAEDDLLAGGFSLDIDDDSGDSNAGPDTSDPQPEWLRLFEIMLVWLNVEHSVPDRTCELLLAFLQSVYYTISTASSSSARRALPSARMARIRKSLGLEGYGITYALCPDRSCLTPHLLREVIERQTESCRRCGLALFHDPQPQAPLVLPVPLKPHQVKVRLRYESITNWLQQLLPRPDILALCRHHKRRQYTPGVYRDLYDGSNWTAHEGDSRFDLVLSLSLMIDWIQPFYRLGTASYSCGVVSVRVDDLPFHMRNASAYTHVCCILPGPQKPTAEGLHATLDIVVAELHRLYEDGLQINELVDPVTGRPVSVRVRLARLLADTEARTSTAGFPSHSSKGQFCPWCTVDHEDWVRLLLQGQEGQARNPADHRRHSLRALPNAVPRLRPAELDSLRRDHAACLSVLYKIPTWSSLDHAPVDVMHNLDLGLCKHFWTQTLVDGTLLDQSDLRVCKEVLQRTTYPTGVTRISPDLGLTSGGTPTAAGWSVLSRYIMPVLLASSWSSLLQTSAQKTFQSLKPTMVKKGLANSAAAPASEPIRQDNVPGPSSRPEATGTARPPRRGQKQKKPVPKFTKTVSLTTILEASLVLALACRLAHARAIGEVQLQLLHRSLKTFVTLIASEIDHGWVPYNFHIALHIADQVRRHGPAWAFWSYPQERSYGLMKRIRTNKHRGGELEHTMHTRSEDRHRIMALLEAMPVTPLSRILRDSIRSEKATGPSSSLPTRSEQEGQDGDTGDNAEDDIDGGEVDTSQTVVFLSNADMQRVCALANKDWNAEQARFVPCFDYNGRIPELVIDSTATSVARLSVGEFILRPRNQRHGIRSDPSACFVSTPGGPRLARFCSVVQIPYVDLRLQDRFKDYAVVEILDALDWQDGIGLSSSTWKELGYLAARSAPAVRTIIDIDDVLGPAIVLPGTRIFGLPDSIIATMIHPAGRN